MIVDIMGSLFMFTMGVIVGVNGTDLFRLRKSIKPPMATKDPEMFLYGKHKMHWYWTRQYDEDEKMRKLPLRTYAKMKSET